MKHIRFVFMFLLCFLFYVIIASPASAKEDLPGIVKRISPSVVVITIYDKYGKSLGLGSGFFIDKKGDVITNYHVLEGADSGVIKTSKGKTYPIRSVLAEDREGDLIRISVEIPQGAVSPLSISTSMPDVGEQIAVIGNPLGLELTVSDGIVSAVREIPGFGRIIQISAPISPGSSGSPVVNMKGEVIGVATFQMIEGQNLNFAIPCERVTNLIEGKRYSFTEWKTTREETMAGSAEELYSTGLSFLWIEEYNKALPYFEEAVKKNPNFAEAYFYIGYCSGVFGLYEEEIKAYKKAILIKPDYADAYYNLGLIYIELKRYSEAIKNLKKVTHIQPNFAKAYFNLAVAYDKLGLHQNAIEAYKQTIRVDPIATLAYLDLGFVYENLGQFQEAINSYKQAILIEPNLGVVHLFLVKIYEKIGQYQEPIQTYKQAISANPNDAIAHFNLGMTYHVLKNYEEARNSYIQAIRINPDLAFPHYQLGSVYSALKRHNDAIKSYKQAISRGLDPDNSSAYSSLGRVYESVGRYRDAIDAYKQAIRINPHDPWSYYSLGCVYLRLGDSNSALKQYKILKTIDEEIADLLFGFIYEN